MIDLKSFDSLRLSLDETYMRNAENWALRSKAVRKKTGAVIVLNNQTVSDGYNGMPADSKDDCCEIITASGELITNPKVIHAEANAILKMAAYGGRGLQGATLYATLSPCINCSGMIIQTKIKRVVYREVYRLPDGLEFLQECGIICDQLPYTDIEYGRAMQKMLSLG